VQLTADQTSKQGHWQVALVLHFFSKTGAEFEVKVPGGEVMASGIEIDCKL
jgi:hypothetical protein